MGSQRSVRIPTVLRATAVGAASLVVCLLAGCAANCTGDPRTDSAGCAASALSNGAYETNAISMTSALAETRNQAEIGQLKQAKLQTDLATLQGRRRAVETQLEKLQLRLKALEHNSTTNDKTIAGLRAAMADLRSGIGANPLNEAQVAAEERGLQILSQQVDAISSSSQSTL